ncbi:outer membrane lipid asymmetry maintenance protein MlaD [Desulfosoma caldarium]|uniref:Phospholipid/cholesterol/gamma-HCH transport system substrate-binding protein n=1 Tax=Desulfosoma caldarium TaxID=610254 RepID=A0A3N1VM26_9BACT|nr:outer membrane lipid asymmetry maintenance protein MlaD [Desulfosoma caldarium]ROR03099.1 phospholipid/cholesterol/gamma-HCH transport system substrate-binding protein [Desulfosoma caldarium]
MNRQSWTVETGVGLFLLIGLVCVAYLSFNLGDVRLWGGGDYMVHARFSNVSGLKKKASVTMAGVEIGRVEDIRLEDGDAVVTLRIYGVPLEEDVIASIKTMGIIGDKYIAVSAGASDERIPPNGWIRETQPPLDVEELIGRFVFGSMEKK